MVGIRAHAVADHLGENGGIAFLRPLHFFQDENTGAFSHNKTVAFLVPGA